MSEYLCLLHTVSEVAALSHILHMVIIQKKFKKALSYQYLLTFPTCAALTNIPLIAVENKNGDQNHAAGQEYSKHKNKQPKS